MIINVVVWKEVVNLDMGGVRKFDEMPDGYNKMQNYKGMLLDPIRNLRNHLGVSGLTAKDRMLVYLITYILTPRSSNHAQVTDDDLRIVYGMESGIKMNQVLLIKDIMMKCHHLVDYKFLYGVRMQVMRYTNILSFAVNPLTPK